MQFDDIIGIIMCILLHIVQCQNSCINSLCGIHIIAAMSLAVMYSSYSKMFTVC